MEFLYKTDLMPILGMDGKDRFYLLLAALAHDNGHEGLSNAYYIKNHKDLALTYLYKSPLEHMHASNLLKKAHLPDPNWPVPTKALRRKADPK